MFVSQRLPNQTEFNSHKRNFFYHFQHLHKYYSFVYIHLYLSKAETLIEEFGLANNLHRA